MTVLETPLTRSRAVTALRVTAAVEAFTWAGLLVGMLLKHVLDVTEAGVWLFGRLHGAAFLAFGAAVLVAWWRLRWSPRVAVLALASAVPPLTSLVFERWATGRGHLTPA